MMRGVFCVWFMDIKKFITSFYPENYSVLDADMVRSEISLSLCGILDSLVSIWRSIFRLALINILGLSQKESSSSLG
jgi:hypothetical protein